VTIQAQVLKVIKDLQEKLSLSLILITHDLGVVAHMVDYVYVMYLGRMVESGPVDQLLVEPLHPYTKGLLRSIPRVRGERQDRIDSIPGTVPDAYFLPQGCPFHSRCNELVGEICKKEAPERVCVGSEHYVSCHIYSGSVNEGGAIDG
jgi:peptide/nickel transport system ATP-binding protein